MSTIMVVKRISKILVCGMQRGNIGSPAVNIPIYLEQRRERMITTYLRVVVSYVRREE